MSEKPVKKIRRTRPRSPTLAEMAGMLAYMDAASKAGGRPFTVYENKIEAWTRDLIREVKALRAIAVRRR